VSARAHGGKQGDIYRTARSRLELLNRGAHVRRPLLLDGAAGGASGNTKGKLGRGEESISLERFIVIRDESYYPAIRLIVAIPKEEILDLTFLYYAIESIDIGHSGTSILQLTVPMVCNLSISIPSLAEQRSIAENLDGLHEETQRLATVYERRLVALEALKKSLLHQAFTGQL